MTEITSQLSAALADRYRIERRLGEGGMATVYLAEDLKHHRKVALKVLKPELAAVIGGERFIHEIEVTAKLQHPNILALFDSGAVGSILYYVMPYVEGESLRERLDRERQLPVEQAVEIAKSVANALDYAHRNGVVHRDIKPENILLHEGQPLVADFGIALAVSAAAGGRLTETGLSLGTPNYMSPEQATAERELNARSDVYSLGVLLYEMLVGQVPFLAPSVQAIVAMILTEEPIPIAARRPSVPPHIEGVVAKAMQKLPADRFSSAQEFGRALSDVTFVGPRNVTRPTGTAEAGRRARSTLVAWAIAATTTVVALVATWAWLGSGPPPSPVHRQRILLWRGGLGERSVRYNAALAPDGSGIAYVDSVGGSTTLLFKPRDAIEATALAGTGEAQAPFFSPDGRWIGFFADGVLKKVARAGGGAATVTSGARAIEPSGAWSEDGSIYFIGADYGLRRVTDDGGESEAIAGAAAVHHRAGRALSNVWPLPGGRGVLFSACTSECTEAEVYAYDAATDSASELFDNALGAWYGPGGYVLYAAKEGGLFAAPFDLRTLRATAGAVPVLEDVGPDDLTLGPDGTLLYSLGAVATAAEELVWVTRDGSASLVDSGWVRAFGHPALSPDARTLAIGVHETRDETNLWLKPLDAGPPSKLTFGGSDDRPAWAPNGGSIAFARGAGPAGLYEVTVGGAGALHSLIEGSDSVPRINEAAYSPDGRWLIYREISGGRSILLARNLQSDSTVPLVAEDYNAYAPAVAPDGHWLAFASDRTGRWEVYVRPFPNASDGEWAVSASGGYAPRWARSGEEIFYLDEGGTMWSVGVVRTVPFRTTTRRRLFDASGYKLDLHQEYDVAPDGRFLMVRDRGEREDAERELVWVENWPEELRAKMKR